jgi:ABC-type multidrug transport system fused ATPase/permease subunit
MEGQLTVGELLVVLSYIGAIYAPLESISGTVGSLQEQLVGLRLAFDILDTDPEIVDRPSARFLARAEGSIAFEGVGFSYSQRMNTLVDVDFEAPAGQVTAVVGPTGAGKSTLVSLIPRFYDPHQGRVLIDGVDIREIKIKSLRNHISLVLQEPLLFSGTIYDNILYGRLEAGDDDVFAAAEAAGAQEFIQRLPKGYKTVLGERGAQLSGGERQRISIARAFLKDAPVLILDEPTSAIDSKTEGLILDALDRLMVGRTTFLIAHRLSTIRNANRILVLNRGRIVEQGTHEELLGGEGGLYRQLYDAQVKPRLVPGDEPRRRAAGVPE